MGSEKGQSLIEVIVAATVGILVVSALTFATIFSLRNANFAKNSAQATKLAQEGIESVRTGRDRNVPIAGNFQINGFNITSWDPDLWSNQISPNCTPNCYFNINSSGELQYLIGASSIPSAAETIDQFKRVVILSDDATSYTIQKTATVIVQWNDSTGSHDSKLTTILGKL
ncbi:MAG: hypothetical protein PHE48_03350 [Candidatus Daviesbacteria bacterium]|nr:hypothetical protein [Candidatus Daviesbacteria bacterium]